MGVPKSLKRMFNEYANGKHDTSIKSQHEKKVRILQAKIEKYFSRHPSKKKLLKMKDRKIKIEYMYGARYLMFRKMDKGKPTLIGTMMTSEKVAESILNEKNKSEGSKYHKLKGMIK
jgi:hypothetical protein